MRVCLSLFFVAACNGNSSWIVRLDDASLPARDCNGDDWGDSCPDVSVELTRNSDGSTWISGIIANECDPDWGVAAFDGFALPQDDLEDFGLGVVVYEGSGLFADQIGSGTAEFDEAGIESGVIDVDADCIQVTLSLLEP